MACPYCGDPRFIHECPGAPPARQAIALEPPPALRFAPVHYLKLALAIARLDEAAIQRASLDNNALLYGLLFYVCGSVLSSITGSIIGAGLGKPIPLGVLVIQIFLLVGCAPFLTMGYYGVCHLLARIIFRANGNYLGILRAMMLGSVVGFLGVIPVVGGYLAGLWGLAIFMWVFEEVDGIERLQAVGISIGILVGFMIVFAVLHSLLLFLESP